MTVADQPVVNPGLDRATKGILTIVILGGFMTILDTTIVNIALESLRRDLHTTLRGVQWVITGYILSIAAMIPLTGWAARRIGPKRLFLLSMTVFTLGSAMCGLARSPWELILFRVIQGVGGGAIVPVGQMILVKAAGPANLPRVMAAYGVPTILAPVFGPTLGGLLISSASWRWIFFINVPIGIFALVRGVRLLPTEPPEEAGPFDVAGLGLVAGGLVALTYGLSQVGSSGSGLTDICIPVVGGVILVAVFVLRALRIAHPLLNMRLYTNKIFAAASLTTFLLSSVLGGAAIMMPLYYQTVRHLSTLNTGLLVAPRGVGATLGTWASRRLMERLGPGATTAIGVAVTLLLSAPFVLLGSHTSFVVISIVLALQGFGIGLTITPAVTAGYRAVPQRLINDATPQQNIIQRVGSSVSTAILLSLLQFYLVRAGSSLSGQAKAFGTTFGWLLAISALAMFAAIYLLVLERRQSRAPQVDPTPSPNVVEVIESLEL